MGFMGSVNFNPKTTQRTKSVFLRGKFFCPKISVSDYYPYSLNEPLCE